MRKIEGFEQINEAGVFEALPAGPYAIKIRDVVDNAEKECLEISFDIAEGKYKHYYATLEKNTGKTGIGKTYRSYKETALSFFKSFIVAIEKSNPNYKWDWNEKGLVGKFCAAEFGEEEYKNDKGEIKVGVKLFNFRSLQSLREGKCITPKKRVLEKPAEPAASVAAPVIDDDELPF